MKISRDLQKFIILHYRFNVNSKSINLFFIKNKILEKLNLAKTEENEDDIVKYESLLFELDILLGCLND